MALQSIDLEPFSPPISPRAAALLRIICGACLWGVCWLIYRGAFFIAHFDFPVPGPGPHAEIEPDRNVMIAAGVMIYPIGLTSFYLLITGTRRLWQIVVQRTGGTVS